MYNVFVRRIKFIELDIGNIIGIYITSLLGAYKTRFEDSSDIVAKQHYDLFFGRYFFLGGSELLILWNRANIVFNSHEIYNTFTWVFFFLFK